MGLDDVIAVIQEWGMKNSYRFTGESESYFYCGDKFGIIVI